MQWIMIGLGAAIGAILRGWLARLNTSQAGLIKWLPNWLPMGTLAANVLGGLLMGVALAVSERLQPSLKFFITTGFLGGLTTFSTFSAETFGLLQHGKILPAMLLILLHVGLTLGATALGFILIKQVL